MVQWDELAPYFSIPYEYEEVEGNFSDPFIFNDGRVVNDLADWKERRKEILEKWHGLMGKWPEMITNPSFEIVDTEEQEGFTQKKIRFEWVPGQWTEGYLLLPHGAKNRPAVVTVYYEPETAIGKGKPNRDFALQLAKRGFVTLSLGTTATTENQTYSIYYPHIDSARVQPLSMLAYAAGNAWHLLASLPEVDKEKLALQAIPMVVNGPCLLPAFSKTTRQRPGQTLASCSTKPGLTSTIGNPGTWATIPDPGETGEFLQRKILPKACMPSW